MVGNFGSIYDIWAFGYRLPIEAAIFMGTMFALLCVALFCQMFRI